MFVVFCVIVVCVCVGVSFVCLGWGIIESKNGSSGSIDTTSNPSTHSPSRCRRTRKPVYAFSVDHGRSALLSSLLSSSLCCCCSICGRWLSVASPMTSAVCSLCSPMIVHCDCAASDCTGLADAVVVVGDGDDVAVDVAAAGCNWQPCCCCCCGGGNCCDWPTDLDTD